MTDQELFDKIEQYLAGELSQDDRMLFEQEMDQNSALKQEVLLHLGTDQILEYGMEKDLRRSLQDWSNNRPTSKRRILRPLLSIAATITILIVGSIWVMQSQYNRQALIDKYYDIPLIQINRQADPTTRSTFQQGLETFAAEEWDEAINLLQQVPTTSSNYERAQIYLGHGYMITDNARRAYDIFTKLNQSADDPTLDWLTLLSAFEQTDQSKILGALDKIMNQTDHPFHERAKSVQQDLEVFWNFWY